MDSSWIFRFLLAMATIVIIFGDFLGYGGANAKSNSIATKSNEEKSNESGIKATKTSQPIYISKTFDSDNIVARKPEDGGIDSKMTIKFFAKPKNELQLQKEREMLESVKVKISESLRDLCLPKLLCEIAAKPEYKLTEKEKIVLSLLKTTTLSIVAETPSRWHFSAHMGQLMRHSIDSMGCAHLFPNCPYSSEKLMTMSGKVKLS